MTISNVRAMDGIMNCVDYKFTLSAKSNIFAVISFSDADTLISIWHIVYLDIVHSSCLSSLSGGKIDNHLSETSQANDGVVGLKLYSTTLTIFAFFQKILGSFRHTQHHFCISFETLFILGLNDPPNWHLVDFKSDYWTGCWVFVVKRWTMSRINSPTLEKLCIVKMNFGDIALICVPHIYQVVELLVMIGGIISLWWLFQFQWRIYSIILKIPSFTDDKVQNRVERVQAAGNPSLLTFPPNFRPCRPKLQNPADKCKICWKYKRR